LIIDEAGMADPLPRHRHPVRHQSRCQDVFAAWVSDRAAGLDAIMLVPTRNLVAELNRQARNHLLGSHPPGRQVRLTMGTRPVSAM
jgi:hypothetical protein